MAEHQLLFCVTFLDFKTKAMQKHLKTAKTEDGREVHSYAVLTKTHRRDDGCKELPKALFSLLKYMVM